MDFFQITCLKKHKKVALEETSKYQETFVKIISFSYHMDQETYIFAMLFLKDWG